MFDVDNFDEMKSIPKANKQDAFIKKMMDLRVLLTEEGYFE
jgi:hypothetical protein